MADTIINDLKFYPSIFSFPYIFINVRKVPKARIARTNFNDCYLEAAIKTSSAKVSELPIAVTNSNGAEMIETIQYQLLVTYLPFNLYFCSTTY